ncbi:hypothetical protein [Pantoea sp. CCBC3-3-1]|uniref:hypothetical protein n=1 Tax=Pantoea sp. CCBC3-3-1 TaxID=2490851 RepID=UPI0011BF92BE|nr:hypothetical protein [Pantoea sp. CCBC3-3-1]
MPGKDLVASFGEIVAGEKHVGLADYRPLGKMRVSSGQRFSRRQLNPRSGNGAISPAKTLRFGNNNVIVQILDSESGQQFVLAVSDHRRGISHAFARHKAKKEA